MSATPVLPIALPELWASEFDGFSGNVVLCAKDAAGNALGFATVDESRRVFALGVCRPYGKASAPAPEYQGFGWRKRLYTGAVQVLQEALAPNARSGPARC